MKLIKTLAFTIFLLFTVLTSIAQERLATVNKLKELVGLKSSGVKKALKAKGYELDEKGETDGFYHEYFTEETYELEIDIIYKNKVSWGAGFEGISATEYTQMLSWMKANGFYLKTKGDIGTERQDLWESNDENWRLVADYATWPAFKPLRIMLYKTS